MIKLFSIFFLVLMGSGLLYAERPTTLYLGEFSGGQDAFEDNVGSQAEFSVLKEFYSFRHFYFEAGLIFWSYKGRIAGHHYALDSLNIPVRVYYSRALFSFLQPFESRALSWTFGYGFGPHFLVENFDQTEAFVALNKSFFFGLIWEDFLPETSLRYELNVGQSEFDFLNNLTVSGVSYRLGVVTRF